MDALDQLVRDLEAERFRPAPRRTPEQLRAAEHEAGLARQRTLYAESLAYELARRDDDGHPPLRAVS